jgi:predicted PurR-regulated permease PerM
MADGPANYRAVIVGISSAFALLILALLLWMLGGALLVILFAIVLGVLLSRGVSALAGRLQIPRWGALALIVMTLTGLFVGLGFLVLTPFIAQLKELIDNLPAYIKTIDQWLAAVTARLQKPMHLTDFSRQMGGDLGDGVSQGIALLGDIGHVLGTVAAVVIFAIFLALNPMLYRRGFLAFFPQKKRLQVNQVL